MAPAHRNDEYKEQHSGAKRGKLPRRSPELDKVYKSRLASCTPSQEENLLWQRCLSELEKEVSALTPGWTVRPFGSTVAGLALRGANLDVTCTRIAFEAGRGAPLAVEDLRESLTKVVTEHDSFSVVESSSNVRATASLGLRYRGILDVELSFQNVEMLCKTQLLRAYTAMHPLVDLKLHLPCLDTSLFKGHESIPAQAKMSWHCAGSLYQLLCGFFQFYRQEFEWGSEVVSVRNGCRLHASSTAFPHLKGAVTKRLHIEDPCRICRNLNEELQQDKERLLFDQITAATEAHHRMCAPVGLGSSEAPPWKLGPLWQLMENNTAKAPACKKTIATGSDPDTESTSAGTYSPGRSNGACGGAEVSSADTPIQETKPCSASKWLEAGCQEIWKQRQSSKDDVSQAVVPEESVRELVVQVDVPLPLMKVSNTLPTILEVRSQEAIAATPSSRRTSIDVGAGPASGPITLEVTLAPLVFSSSSVSPANAANRKTLANTAGLAKSEEFTSCSPIVIDVQEASIDSSLNRLTLLRKPIPSPREIEVTYVLPQCL